MRVKGWERKLIDAVEVHTEQKFEWGVSDCITLVSDVALAITGEDPMGASRGRYKTEKGATKVLKKLGYDNVAEALAASFPEIPPASAKRGDCGVVEVDGVMSSVVVMGSHLVGKSVNGAILTSPTRLTRAFKVG